MQIDKGECIIIFDFKEYFRTGYQPLEAKIITDENYYKKVGESIMKEAKDKITKIVKEA